MYLSDLALSMDFMNTEASSKSSKYLLSIITVSFNSVTTIADTLQSVRAQIDDRVEYLVIDGGSTDGTHALLNRNVDIIDQLISESDAGIYEAMNKGFGLSRGMYIWFLNSDDWLADGALRFVISTLEKEGCPRNYLLTGVTQLVDYDGVEVGLLKLTPKSLAQLYKSNPFPHPSTIVSRDIMAKCRGFNCNYKVCADYDFFIRASLLKPTIVIANNFFSIMRTGGVSGVNARIGVLLLHQRELYTIQSHFRSRFFAIVCLIPRMVKLFIKRLCW